MGLDPSTVPGSAAEVEAYYESVRPSLRMTKEAAETMVFLTAPPVPWKVSLPWSSRSSSARRGWLLRHRHHALSVCCHLAPASRARVSHSNMTHGLFPAGAAVGLALTTCRAAT